MASRKCTFLCVCTMDILHNYLWFMVQGYGFQKVYLYFPCVCTMDPLKNYLSHMVKNMASRKCPFGVFAPLILFRTTCQWPCSASGCFLWPWMHPCYSKTGSRVLSWSAAIHWAIMEACISTHSWYPHLCWLYSLLWVSQCALYTSDCFSCLPTKFDAPLDKISGPPTVFVGRRLK